MAAAPGWAESWARSGAVGLQFSAAHPGPGCFLRAPTIDSVGRLAPRYSDPWTPNETQEAQSYATDFGDVPPVDHTAGGYAREKRARHVLRGESSKIGFNWGMDALTYGPILL